MVDRHIHTWQVTQKPKRADSFDDFIIAYSHLAGDTEVEELKAAAKKDYSIFTLGR